MNDNVEKKDFGYEITWMATDNYVCKILVFDQCNKKTPITFHKETTKSWFVNSGKFKISWIDTKDGKVYEQEVGEGAVFHAPPCMPCGLESLSNEASISQVSDKNDPKDVFLLSRP